MAAKLDKDLSVAKSADKSSTKVTTTAHVEFSEEMINEMMVHVASGKSLASICRMPQYPSRNTFFKWVSDKQGIAEQYQVALNMRAELFADEIIEISDDADNDTYTDDNGNVRTNNEVVARSKLKVDSRKWIISKLLPKKYGDSINLNHSGKINLTDEQLESKLALLLGKAGITSADGVEEVPS